MLRGCTLGTSPRERDPNGDTGDPPSEVPMFRYVLADAPDMANAVNTFVVYDGDNAIGRVTALSGTNWRITYAGLGVTNFSRAIPFISRNEAVRELVQTRNIARATRT